MQSFNPSGLNQFTLRQIPTLSPTSVPEPTTLDLLGASLVCLGINIGKRRKFHPLATSRSFASGETESACLTQEHTSAPNS